MCSIVGLIDRAGENVGPSLLEMLRATEHRGPDGCGLLIGDSIRIAPSQDRLDVSGMAGPVGLGHARLRITGDTGIQPLTGCGADLTLAFNGEIWDHESWRRSLEGRGHRFRTDTDSEVLIHLIEERRKDASDLVAAVRAVVEECNGEYAFALNDAPGRRVLLVRDPVGVKQLYYGEAGGRAAFCSEKKPLWGLGATPRRVLPGECVEVTQDGAFRVRDRVTLERLRTAPSLTEEAPALETYGRALEASMRRRLAGQPRVGIIFSGGVDSVLIAALAQRLGGEVRCYAAGFPDSTDVHVSRRAAEAMGLPLEILELSEEGIEKEMTRVLTAIESTDHLQVDVALPIYFAVQGARRDGMRVLLTGQGADELFAGYPWYPDTLRRDGPAAMREAMWGDLGNLYRDTLEREDKITMYHSIELRVPYLDPEVIRASFAIDGALMIREDHVKHIHRLYAASQGVPDFVAWRPKEAAQHGSRTHEVLRRILERRFGQVEEGTTARQREKLGSAYRHGHDAYVGNEPFQRVLDAIGAQQGIV